MARPQPKIGDADGQSDGKWTDMGLNKRTSEKRRQVIAGSPGLDRNRRRDDDLIVGGRAQMDDILGRISKESPQTARRGRTTGKRKLGRSEGMETKRRRRGKEERLRASTNRKRDRMGLAGAGRTKPPKQSK